MPILVLFFFAARVDTAQATDVVILLSANAKAYQKAVEGFREVAQGKGLQIAEIYDMNGNLKTGKTILKKIKSKDKPDLIYAVGVLALRVIAQQKIDIPVVYAMVLNPPSVLGAGATNITGASMNVSSEQSLRLFKQLGPNIRRIGAVFKQDNTGYLVNEAYEVAQELGLELVAKQVDSSKSAIAAIKALQHEQVDALWVLPDKTTLDPKVIQQMLLLSYRHKLPLLGLSERHAEMGTLLAVSFSSGQDIGMQAGELANQLLKGVSPADIPYTTVRRVNLFINRKAAKKLDIDMPPLIEWTQADAASDQGMHTNVKVIE